MLYLFSQSQSLTKVKVAVFNESMKTTPSVIADRIADSEVLGKLNADARARVGAMVRERTLSKNEPICYQGDQCKFVLFIQTGSLRSVINASNGREHVISTWEAGEEFWSHTLFDDEPMPSTLQGAENNTIIFQWPGEPLYELILRNELATRALIRRQTRLIRKRREKIYNLAFNPVASRLAKLILDKYTEEGNAKMQRDLTLEDMAAMVASSPEVVCRVMYQFQSEGLLTIDRATITLNNQEDLEKMVLRD